MGISARYPRMHATLYSARLNGAADQNAMWRAQHAITWRTVADK